jgi:hypothetical protein
MQSVKDNLRKRGIVSDFLCSICGLEIESTHHILWSTLSISDGCLGVSEIKFQKSTCCGFDFLQMVTTKIKAFMDGFFLDGFFLDGF